MLMRSEGATYDTLRAGFAWRVPAKLNIGVACADRQPAGARALVDVGPAGEREFTFGDLTALSGRLANALRGLGVQEGDRVGIVLPQCAETGIAHLSVYKLGAVAIPMSVLFGPQALMYRLGDAEAKVVITDRERLDAVAEVARELPGLQVIVVDDDVPRPYHAFWPLLGDGREQFAPVDTDADAPALLIYTSGTTGPPKGALHGHRVLLGHLPGFQLSHRFFPEGDDCFWTPADWAWIGGLMDALMPSWYFGRPVIATTRQRFDPEQAVELIAARGIRNVFLPPTVLKMMRQENVTARGALRSIACGGEPLGEEMLGWAAEHLGVGVSEMYGQTEANYVVGNCPDAWPVRPGSMGRPYPGHEVAVLGPDGAPAAPGAVGELAVGTDDPVVFLRYWNRPAATEGKLTPDGRWLLTGDLGHADEDGYLWFASRSDDVISSAGYRIGPAEIEECLMRHAAVTMAAAIGVPDPIRGEVVKAFVQLAPDQAPSAELEEEIRQLVRARLAAYEYPRHIEFVTSLPLTTTGKIRRAALREREQT